MPFALIIVGIVLVVSAVRDTTDDLFTLVKGDFTGKGNFSYWLVSILIIGGLGYVKPIQPLSRVFLALVVIVLFLSNGGFFNKFSQQVFGSTTGGGSITPGAGGINLGSLATPQPWAENYQLPTNLGIESPIASGRNQ